MRILLVGLSVVLGSLAWTPGAGSSTGALLEPGARIHTIAGGGVVPPAEGMAATDARLHVARVAVAPDGAIVLTEESGARAGWRIDASGRLRALPALVVDGTARRARDLDVAPDGAVLAVARGDGSVFRLPPGAGAWVPLGVPVNPFGLREIAALADGGALVAGGDRVWRLSAAGETLWSRRGPGDELGQPSTDQLVGLPGDAAAVIQATGSGLVVFGATGSERRRFPGRFGHSVALAAVHDGSLVEHASVQVSGTRWVGVIRFHGAGASPQNLFGLSPRLGRGDGGLARHALFGAGLIEYNGIAVGPRGELVVTADSVLDAHGHLDMEAAPVGRRLATDFDVPHRSGELVRVIGASAQPTVAIRPATYGTLDERRVAISSSFAGTATLRILHGRRLIREVKAAVPAGDSTLSLPRRLAPADYRLELSVTDAARRVTHRIGISTRRRLDSTRGTSMVRRVLRTYEDGGDGLAYELHARKCRRTSPVRIACSLWSTLWDFNDAERHCEGTVVARQRPDGLRVALHWRRSLCGGR